MLTTNVASCKRVGRRQGLNMPPICERERSLPVETAMLTAALPSFPGNIRNICIFLERKRWRAKISTKLTKARKLGRRSKKDLKGNRVKTTLAGNQIYVGRGPAIPRQCRAICIWFFLLLAWPGFKPKARDSVAGLWAVSLWTKGLITTVLVSRTQNIHDRHQLSSKISCHACL